MLFSFIQTAAESPAYGRVIANATVVIAIATVLYLITTFLLWLTTRENVFTTKNMFEASHRPYVGPTGITRKDAASPRMITFNVFYRNVGTVPASECNVTVQVVTDGVLIPMEVKEEEEHSVAFPNVSYQQTCVVSEPNELDRVTRASTLAIVFRCSYKGVGNQTYHSEEKYAFNKQYSTFTRVKGTYS